MFVEEQGLNLQFRVELQKRQRKSGPGILPDEVVDTLVLDIGEGA
jgi:hypothetical protein